MLAHREREGKVSFQFDKVNKHIKFVPIIIKKLNNESL